MRLLSSVLFFFAWAASAHEPEASTPFERPHAHNSVKGHVHTGWESHYLSEGRDSLDGDSLWASSLELGWRHFSTGIWYGLSPDQNFDELQMSLAVSENVGDFELYGGYTHLRFPSSDSHDNEMLAGIVWSGLPLELELGGSVSYSFDADGFFSELALSREIELLDRLSMAIDGVFGLNNGFVPDGHNGANHFALRVGAQYTIFGSWSLTAHTAYSWALDRDSSLPGDEQLIDFFHGGVGIQWSF